jgi:nucleotide-binding universal stress UspA family protein
MLVVGSRGVGTFAAMLLGSVSRYAATHAACPVVVVREETGAGHRQIGVGVGDLEHCGVLLDYALEEAAMRNAGLIVLHAWQIPETDISRAGVAPAGPAADVFQLESERELGELLNGWREKYPRVPVSQDVVHGHLARSDSAASVGSMM